MRITSLLLGLFAFAGARMVPAATAPDLAIFNVIRQTDPTLVSDKVIHRNVVAPDLDLVIAIASTADSGLSLDSTGFYWGENQKLGLFLQGKTLPDRVFMLALAAGPPDCGARIERATSTDTVISCTGEKSWQGMNQKFVYDVRAKALVSHFAYQPFAILQAFDASGRTVFVGWDVTDRTKRVAVEFHPDMVPEFRVLDKGEAAPWLARVGQAVYPGELLYPDAPTPIRFGEADAFTFTQGHMDIHGDQYPPSIVDSQGKKYPLPQSTFANLAKARPEVVQSGYHPIIEETIGPVQPEGDKLWFGKTFYDSEGVSGIGGFGYFDATDRQYHLFSLPAVTDSSISGIRVEPDTVWMGMFHRGEYGGGSAGILRYDRRTQAVRKYDLPDIVNGFVSPGNRLLAYTSFGIAVIEGEEMRRYFVDRTTDGRLRIAEVTR